MMATPAPASKLHWPHGWPYVLLALGAILAYANVYPNSFLFDDEFLLVKNTYLQSWKHIGAIFSSSSTAGFGGKDSFYRPLQIFSYLVASKLFGFSTYTFHALNVFLHALNACLLFALARKMKFHRIAALLASLMWALHPIHTEAVTYMSGTADVLAALFILAGLLCWDEKGWRPAVNAFLCFILALLSKETAVVFPALLVVMIAARPAFSWKPVLKTWPFWLVALGYVALRGTVLNFDQDFHFYKVENSYSDHIDVRIYSFLATLPEYIRLLVLPVDLHIERKTAIYSQLYYLKPLLGLLVLAISALCVGLAIRLPACRPLRPLAFGIAWFFAAYFPCSGILLAVNSIFLEHWMYLPAAGLFIGVGEAMVLSLPDETSKAITAIVAAIVKVIFFILTLQQNALWRDPITFYLHILSFEQGTGRVHNNLAMAYDDAGRSDLAMEHYKLAIATEDMYAQTHYNLGRLYIKLGDLEDGRDEMKRALALDPTFWRASKILERLGK